MSSESQYPSPAEVRGPSRPNQTVPIRWDVVDPWLLRLRRGKLRSFALWTGISITTLHRRRLELGIRLNERRRMGPRTNGTHMNGAGET